MTRQGAGEWIRTPTDGSDGGGVTSKASVQLADSYTPSGASSRTIPFGGLDYHEFFDTDGYIDTGNNGFTVAEDGEYDVGFIVQIDGSAHASTAQVSVYTALLIDDLDQWTPQMSMEVPAKGSNWQVVMQANGPVMVQAGDTVQFKWYSMKTGVVNSLSGGFWIRRVGDYIEPAP
jgi:hypothetical protein